MQPEAESKIIADVQTLFMSGKLDEAIESIENARLKYPENSELKRVLALLLTDRGVARASQRGQSEAAYEDLLSATELNPDQLKAWKQLSLMARERGEVTLALRYAANALALDPQPGSDPEFSIHYNTLLEQSEPVEDIVEIGSKPMPTLVRMALATLAGILTIVLVGLILRTTNVVIPVLAGLAVMIAIDAWLKKPGQPRQIAAKDNISSPMQEGKGMRLGTAKATPEEPRFTTNAESDSVASQAGETASCAQCGRRVLTTKQFYDLVETYDFDVDRETGQVTNRVAGDYEGSQALILERQQLLTSLENERGFQCVDCKSVFCPTCLSGAPIHPTTRGRACPRCGGRFQRFD